ncbi:MAG TPA: hypothetical protein V6C95_23940 [Coleofasciculaceae cyanobacterium]
MKPETIAQYYLAAPAYEVPSDIARDFQHFIIDLAHVELQGITCQYVDFQPYLTGTELSREAMQTDVNSGNLLISNQFNESELLGPEINLIFRSIHDLHHVKLNVDFSWQGECASARYIMSLTDNILFKQLLFSEILGQSSVCLSTGTFPEDQKIVLFERDILQNLSQI